MTMRAWIVERPGLVEGNPLRWVELPIPQPAADEVLIRVIACGVCRTDLHVTEGDLPVHKAQVVPGHEIVGEVVAAGSAVTGPAEGSLVGAAWLRRTCGQCRYCLGGKENLCPRSEYTGWDADGGYAEYVCAPAGFCYELPPSDPADLAPLLCAGIIGYRALQRAAVPEGGRLGLYGFGGSAHLCAQVAIAEGARVHVLTRGGPAQQLALRLGASSAADAYASPPESLDSAIIFAPVGDLVPVAMRALDRGGTCAVAGIHLTDIPRLEYQTELFYEKQLRSVTSNTRADGRAFLAAASRHQLRPTTHVYPFDQAPAALRDLKAGRFDGAAVLRIGW
ncbi:zinc-binding alcohol dehydrogenase family protein [Microlunatus sp. Gsoil 973]|uniref:zinc-binding alcohol dehydrogenase family protein n=1 Tax=Microlunatus sp. Gsoil 973 TaxID=2672569 RepID=UPI001E294865|nr:zinc-binding alcohol dehydrogenase family protein [Microlunatus sp. Gsoil 973]